MTDNQNSSDPDYAHGIAFIQKNRKVLLDLCAGPTETFVLQRTIERLTAPAMLNGVEGLVIQWRHNAQGCGRRDQHAAGTWRSCARELEAALRAADTNVTESNACRDAAVVTDERGQPMTYWGGTPTAVGEAITSNASLAGEAAADHVRTGVFDRNGVEICAGDRIVILLNGKGHKKEYWDPEYVVVWKAPSFKLEWVGGGKSSDTATWYFGLGTPQGYEKLEVIAHPPAAEVREVDARAAKALLSARSHIGARRPDDEDDAAWWDELTELAAALQKEKVND